MASGPKSTPVLVSGPKSTPALASGPKSTPASPVLSTQASNAALQDLPKPKGRGRPRKVYAPCPDDDIQIVESLQVSPPPKVGRPKKIERKHSGSNKAVSHLESTVSPPKSVSAGKTAVQLPKRKGRRGRPRKILIPSSDDEVQIVEPVAVQPVKVVRPESKPPGDQKSFTISLHN